MKKTVLLEKSDGVALITLNRPDALNALDQATLLELERLLLELREDSSIGALILTGAGDRAFAAGADIAAMVGKTPDEARRYALLAQRVLGLIEKGPQPAVAAVNGFALGGGCELALCCDMRIACETARLGQPEINLAIIPGWGGTQRLPRLVGRGRALELLLTGEMVDAAEAWRIGMVNRVVSREELLPQALELAQKIASKARMAARLCKEAVWQGLEMDLARADAFEADLFALCFAGEDQTEGMRAFLEKRPAKFVGR